MPDPIPCCKSQRTILTRLPPLVISSSPLDISLNHTMPQHTMCLPKSTDSLWLSEASSASYLDVKGVSVNNNGDGIYDYSMCHSFPLVMHKQTEQDATISLPYRSYCESWGRIYGSNSLPLLLDVSSMIVDDSTYQERAITNVGRSTQPLPKSVTMIMNSDSGTTSSTITNPTFPPCYTAKLDAGQEVLDDLQCCTSSSSEGYGTASSNRSWTSGDTALEPTQFPKIFANGSQNLDFMKNSSSTSPLLLPPATYADSSPDESHHHYDQVGASQDNNGSVSDFFSQSGSSSGSSETSPVRAKSLTSRDNLVINNMTLVSGTHHSLIHITPVTRSRDCLQSVFPRSSVPTNPSRCSPIAKRGRFAFDCESRLVDQTASKKHLLYSQIYCNEYARDTFMWLTYQEANIHAIGPLFMSAQKPTGASTEDRRSVLLRAISEMRKRKHTLEAIHLGAYILDKCLDSFHVSKDALPDVCAVSMVLATKMEEYDSLQPGTVKGLVGATKDKSRLCDIEKLIVFELVDGLCFPTPLVFANYMLAELRCNEEEIRFAHYLLDLALLNSRFRDEGGPRVAHAAVCISSTIVRRRESPFDSECRALLFVERSLLHLTKFPIGSTRDVMRRLMYEMTWALQERHSVLIDYLCEDNRRVCFCEGSPALWELICGARSSSCGRRNTLTEF